MSKNFSKENTKKIFKTLSYSENIEYFHQGLNKNQYLIHPLRVAHTIIENVKNIDVDLLVLALLHNLIEVSKISNLELENLFGKRILESINLLTVDRSKQWEKKYKKIYYENLNNADDIVPIVKVFDKLDNIYLLCTNPNEKIRNMYVNELNLYVISLSIKYIPQITDSFKEAIKFALKDGYIPLDKLFLQYDL